jgi:hypothetical protein
MNRTIKFRVYYEAELNGEKLKGMEEPCSWFLLTQTGQIMEYGPTRPPSRPNKGYTKLIPLFFTGLSDRNGKEIWEGDILRPVGKIDYLATINIGWSQDGEYGFYWKSKFIGQKMLKIGCIVREVDQISERYEVIGNIYENPELLK